MTDWLREHFTASDAGVRPHWRRSTTSRVNLSNNEMCHPAVARLLTEAVAGLRPEDWISYPDYAVARDRFAGLLGVPAAGLLFTAGSDQAYRAVLHAFAAPGRVLLTQRPNYGQIFPYAALTGFAVECVDYRPGEGFSPAEFLAAVRRLPPGSLVAVSNPNGPTGAWWAAEEVAALADACAAHRHMLIIDEAYAAYAPERVFTRVSGWPQVIVVRSFSKEYGLAGTRLAVCACGSPEVADHIQRWNVTNPVSGPALRVGLELASRTEEFTRIHAELNASRERLATELPRLVGGSSERSRGNFVPVRCTTPEAAAECVAGLAARGYAVRHLARFGLPHHLRVSTADKETTDGLLDALGAFVRGREQRAGAP
ncbi:aminotransferase class I/II-fold pyridoxal phosphate-dependent enzyme [Streptomyces sp. NPDC032161]|uniref:aminotransferase class I/II-fold pyridoxal phosphate-dependent enzyme n=1 Tax=unclassified Streptomyces TaxID=2593676 RepID=UPI0033F71BEF